MRNMNKGRTDQSMVSDQAAREHGRKDTTFWTAGVVQVTENRPVTASGNHRLYKTTQRSS